MTKKQQLTKTSAGHRARAQRPPRLSTRVAAAARRFVTANAVAVRFCVLFPLLLLLCWLALQWTEVNRYLVLPFATLIATLSAAILGLLKAGATLSGAVITGPGVSLVVVERCSTIFEMGIFLAAIIAYPAQMRSKLLGALLGVGSIFLLGLGRVVALYFIGRDAPAYFELAHIQVGQSLLILLIALLWIYWVERYARTPGPAA